MTERVWMLDEEWVDHTIEAEFFAENGVQFRASRRDTLSEDWESFGCEAQALIAQVGFPIPDDLLERLPSIRGIVVPGVGFDHIDLPWARRHHLTVSNIPDYCTPEVAEHTLAMVLYFLRDLGTMSFDVHQGIWDPLKYLGCRRATDSILGIVGVGRIGRAVASRSHALGFQVVAYDPFVDHETIRGCGAEPLDLFTLMQTSDYVSVHVPLTVATYHLVSRDLLAVMKSDAVLINTARAAVVDTDALFDRLSGGWLRGAGLDVFDDEPLPANSRWLRLPQVLPTPHAAYVTTRAVVELRQRAAAEALRLVAGMAPQHPVF